jgi:hypothetical protein
VVLLYDAHAFVTRSTVRAKLRSAADPDYSDSLRGAGAMPTVVPLTGVLDDPA